MQILWMSSILIPMVTMQDLLLTYLKMQKVMWTLGKRKKETVVDEVLSLKLYDYYISHKQHFLELVYSVV